MVCVDTNEMAVRAYAQRKIFLCAGHEKVEMVKTKVQKKAEKLAKCACTRAV